MKTFLGTISLGLLLGPLGATAQFNYSTNNGAVTLTGYSGPGGSVTIPSFVSSIGASAFQYNKRITALTIPSSVRDVGYKAFYWCQNLTNVTLSNGLLSLGDGAFGGCWQLRTMTIPQTVTNIGQFVFEYCTDLASVDLGRDLLNIDAWGFRYCSSLQSVTLPPGVANLGDFAFGSCSALTNVTLSPGLLSLGSSAFGGCSNLATVDISASVTKIGLQAFVQCSRLTAINVDPGNPVFSSLNGVLLSKTSTTLIEFPGGLGGSYAVPDGVTKIAPGAFEYNAGLLTVTLPSSLTYIEDYAFADCSNLTGVYFKGDAPLAAQVFMSDPKAVAYYLPGTANWGSSYGGIPTAQWLVPHLLISSTDPWFGMHSNSFSFKVSGVTTGSVVVEASLTMSKPVWIPLWTNQLSDAPLPFNGPLLSDPCRFYRARLQ